MKNTVGSVTYNLGLRKSTVRNFCTDFNINLNVYMSGNLYNTTTIFNQIFIDFLLKNKDFLVKYENDYYSNKTPEIIAKKINKDEKDVIQFLKQYYPKYFKDGEFDNLGPYPLRYISSYKIDYLLNNYDTKMIIDHNILLFEDFYGNRKQHWNLLNN